MNNININIKKKIKTNKNFKLKISLTMNNININIKKKIKTNENKFSLDDYFLKIDKLIKEILIRPTKDKITYDIMDTDKIN
jgi:hypothetical protein